MVNKNVNVLTKAEIETKKLKLYIHSPIKEKIINIRALCKKLIFFLYILYKFELVNNITNVIKIQNVLKIFTFYSIYMLCLYAISTKDSY